MFLLVLSTRLSALVDRAAWRQPRETFLDVNVSKLGSRPHEWVRIRNDCVHVLLLFFFSFRFLCGCVSFFFKTSVDRNG